MMEWFMEQKKGRIFHPLKGASTHCGHIFKPRSSLCLKVLCSVKVVWPLSHFHWPFFHQRVVCYGLAWPSANVGRQHVGARYGHLCAPTFEYWHCSEKSCNKHDFNIFSPKCQWYENQLSCQRNWQVNL